MFTKKILSQKLESFYASVGTDKKTLDVGSRSGRHSEFFSDIVTVDIDPKSEPDIVADAHELPFPDDSFEVVLCREVLEHVKDPVQVISEIQRVLKPGGVLYLSTRFMFPIHEAPVDRWRFTRYLLEELFEGWNQITVNEEIRPMLSIACILQRLAWQTEFKFAGKIFKGLILLLAYVFTKLDGLVKHQYGDIGKTQKVDIAFTTGYYVTATK